MADSPLQLVLPIAIAGVAGGAVLLLGGGWDGAAVALVGGVAAALARGGEAPAVKVPEPEPDPTRLDQVLDGVAEPVLLLRAGRVAIANRAARALLGTHVVGEDARVAIRHPAAADALAAANGQPVALAGLAGRDALWEMRVAALEENGRVVHLSDRSGSAAAERMRVDFVANASHELRTPLASILGYAETLDEEAGDDPAIRHRFLRIVMDEARRMQRLVEDLLSLSRIEADKYRLPDTAVDVGDLISEVCEEMAASGHPRAADLACPTDIEMPAVAGDRAQLSQLLHNLVGNAMKYGRAGTPVRVGVVLEGTRIRVTVADEGDGIPPEHLPRLTERFYRVDAGRSRALGGTGLGLAIVKHIAERHRGRLDVTSRVGVGTTVTVTLPVIAPELAGPPVIKA
jgi:two-component system phosphate regulon sensor histidine kinase PhoR